MPHSLIEWKHIHIYMRWDTDSCSGGEMSAIQVQVIMTVTIVPPPIRLNANERRAVGVAQSRWSQTMPNH